MTTVGNVPEDVVSWVLEYSDEEEISKIREEGSGFVVEYVEGGSNFVFRTSGGQWDYSDGNNAYRSAYAHACGYKD